MIQFNDSPFSSCQGLQDLFKPLSADLVALQMSRGPLEGRLRRFQLGAIRFNLLETNQSLFLSGTRRPEPCTVAIPLDDASSTSPYRAQGIPVSWPALMGYNRQLTDFDLRLPSGARLATIVIRKDTLLEQLDRLGGSQHTLERWAKTNQLELLPELRQMLRNQLNELIQRGQQQWTPDDPNQLIKTMISCFEEAQARTMPVAKRETRHAAAIELLHWCSNNPSKNLTITELSDVLHQSRTSLFTGCQEHFGRTPTELQRSIRLDLVRQLLLNPKRSLALGLSGVGAIAAHMGFTSRSHFARRYEQHYNELPQQTLIQGCADDKKTLSNKSI